MTKKYSEMIADAVKAFLVNDDWKYTFLKEIGVFRFSLSLRGRLHTINYFISIHPADYVVYAISPIAADPKDGRMMRKMMEFIGRANYGMSCGNFELDLNDGEIRFKCYVSCEGDAIPTSEIIRESIYTPANLIERYAPGILGIIFQDKSPSEMIRKCEDIRREIRELASILDENGSGPGNLLKQAAARAGISLEDLEDDPEDGSEEPGGNLDWGALADLFDDENEDDDECGDDEVDVDEDNGEGSDVEKNEDDESEDSNDDEEAVNNEDSNEEDAV